jgi:SAM-dependent methyltransferase
MKQTWAAPERNKAPILEVLRRVLPTHGVLLEVASGSGQHAVFFARELPRLSIQPSDVDPENLASIRAWVAEAECTNLRPPIALDVLQPDWGVGTVDAIFSANMIHIAPWASCEGLLRGAGHHLRPGGRFALYGPFRVQGSHTSESNVSFDASLRARDARWGVRDAEQVIALAAANGLAFDERVAMPANNQTLVFTRAG